MYSYDMDKEIKKFEALVINTIISIYKLPTKQAEQIVDNSTFKEIIYQEPEFVGHYSPEDWSVQIFEESKLIQK